MKGDPIDLHALIGQYLRAQVRRGVMTPATARGQRAILERFADSHGNRPVTSITQRAVERWTEGFGDYMPATRRNHWSIVNRWINFLTVEGHVAGNPMVQMKAPKVPRRLPRALQLDDIGRLLAVAPDARGRLIVLLMVQCGLRRAEVARLELGDVSFADRTIRVRGKGDHERLLPVPAEAWSALTAYASELGTTTGPLLRSTTRPERGLATSTIGHFMSDWLLEAGVKSRPHDGVSGHALRHTAATDMLRAGAHLRDVQHALGHAHLVTTERYLPMVVHGLAEAMEGRRYAHPPLTPAGPTTA